MSNKIELPISILAAGRQTRFDLNHSKMMAKVDDKPAFHFTMKSILEVLPEEFVTIISSTLFNDFNDYVTDNYKKARLIFDSNPGSGSAKSLQVGFPWNTDTSFVSEANIYYESSLLEQMYALMQSDKQIKGVLAGTNELEIAPTHRLIGLTDTSVDLTGKADDCCDTCRNVGVYLLNSEFQNHVQCSDYCDVIDVLNSLDDKIFHIACISYFNNYLHINTSQDLPMWESVLGEKK